VSSVTPLTIDPFTSTPHGIRASRLRKYRLFPTLWRMGQFDRILTLAERRAVVKFSLSIEQSKR
jgi:hypothetical protein